MTKSPATCSICKGSKHVRHRDGWARCQCALDAVRHRRYREAGVPAVHYETPIELLGFRPSKFWELLPKVFDGARKPVMGWLQTPLTSAERLCATAAALRIALDKGHDAASITLQQVIDSRFDAGLRAAMSQSLQTATVCVLTLDLDFSHRMIPAAFGDAWYARTSKPVATLIISADDLRLPIYRPKYGELVDVFTRYAGHSIHLV